jgi:hypothetical protein
MNDGNNGDLDTEVTGFETSKPDIVSHTIDLSLTGTVGLIYKFKVRAENYAGTVDTNALSVVLASLPSKPTNDPTSNPEITNESTLGIQIDIFTDANNGGSPILNYEIQFDDGDRGDFVSVF